MGEVVNNVQDDAVTTQMEGRSSPGSGAILTGGGRRGHSAYHGCSRAGADADRRCQYAGFLATITTYVYAHELDFMILEKDVFDYYCNPNAFADLGELLGAGA